MAYWNFACLYYWVAWTSRNRSFQ